MGAYVVLYMLFGLMLYGDVVMYHTRESCVGTA